MCVYIIRSERNPEALVFFPLFLLSSANREKGHHIESHFFAPFSLHSMLTGRHGTMHGCGGGGLLLPHLPTKPSEWVTKRVLFGRKKNNKVPSFRPYFVWWSIYNTTASFFQLDKRPKKGFRCSAAGLETNPLGSLLFEREADEGVKSAFWSHRHHCNALLCFGWIEFSI